MMTIEQHVSKIRFIKKIGKKKSLLAVVML